MDEQLRQWQPSADEVASIVEELRPIIRELAERDRREIAEELERRGRIDAA